MIFKTELLTSVLYLYNLLGRPFHSCGKTGFWSCDIWRKKKRRGAKKIPAPSSTNWWLPHFLFAKMFWSGRIYKAHCTQINLSAISFFVACRKHTHTHTHTHTVNRWRKQTSIRPWWRRATTASYVVSSTRCSYAGWCVSHSDVDSVSDSSYNVQYSCYVNKSSVTLLLNWVLSSALGFDLGTWLYIRN